MAITGACFLFSRENEKTLNDSDNDICRIWSRGEGGSNEGP